MNYIDTLGLDFFKKADIVPYLEGEAGIGKTSMVEQYAKARDMECIIMGVASLDHIEFYGRTIATEIKTNSTNESYNVFKKSIPVWISKIIENDLAGKETLLFIDELNRAELQNIQSLMNLILKREFGSDSIKLPKSLFIVAAGNPSDNGDYSVESLDKAILSRMAILKLSASLESWKYNYALKYDDTNERQKIHPLIISYLENNRTEFLVDSESDDGSNPGMDPRRWDMASRLLYSYEEIGKDTNKNLALLLSSVVGAIIAPKLFHYIVNSDMLTFTKINEELNKFKNDKKIKALDQYLTNKKEDSEYIELLNSIKNKWDNSQTVTQLNIITSAYYALKAESISEDIFAIILKISTEEHIMSIKKGIEGSEKIIKKIDSKFNTGAEKKVADGLIKHIEDNNPFLASLLS
jgi:hypothetical protein